ncbi:unnamed protein product, partial [Tenebrio molitor]
VNRCGAVSARGAINKGTSPEGVVHAGDGRRGRDATGPSMEARNGASGKNRTSKLDKSVPALPLREDLENFARTGPGEIDAIRKFGAM